MTTSNKGRGLYLVLLLLTGATILLVSAWLATYGTWHVFDRELFGDYYDAQARSILQGRLDVPLEQIGDEAFINRGKYYGYFGIAPALLRIPLHLLFPALEGRWSRAFMLVGCLVSLVFSYRLLKMAEGFAPDKATPPLLRRAVYIGFVLLIGLGSPSIFLFSRSFTFHEAILLSVAFALACYYYVLRYLSVPRIAYLWSAGLLCFLSFMTRAVAGAGVLLTLGLLAGLLLLLGLSRRVAWPGLQLAVARLHALVGMPQVEQPLRHAGVIVAALIATMGLFFTVNYLKFDTFDGVPVQLYSLYMEHPEHMVTTQGKQIHLLNLPSTAVNYFVLFNLAFTPEFPWVTMTSACSLFPGARIYIIEPFTSIPASMPALGMLALLGLVQIRYGQSALVRKFRLALLGAMTASLLICLTVGITERYLHEHMPLLILCGVLGVQVLLAMRRATWRRLTLLSLLPLALFSIYVHIALAVTYQQKMAWAIWTPPNYTRNPYDQPPADPLAGQYWEVDGGRARLRYSGIRWETLARGPSYGLFDLSVTFNPQPANPVEPLLSVGKLGAAETVVVRYQPDGSATLAFDHRGSGGPISAPFRIEPGRAYRILINLDQVNKAVGIAVDGQVLLRQSTPILPMAPQDLSIGAYGSGGAGRGARFSGTITLLNRDNGTVVAAP